MNKSIHPCGAGPVSVVGFCEGQNADSQREWCSEVLQDAGRFNLWLNRFNHKLNRFNLRDVSEVQDG